MKKNVINNNRVMLTVAMFVTMVMIVFGMVRLVSASEESSYHKSFVSIEIEEGDTLTSIAHQYVMNEGMIDSYIDEVCKINNLKNDVIHAGCYLVVPVYEKEL